MGRTRIWDQVVGVFPPYLSLTLIHPEKGGHTHWTDIEFLEEVESRNWYEALGYALSGWGKENLIRLHWLPLGKPPEGMMIDHIDRNQFNSCRDNLRVVFPRVNNFNMKNNRKEGPGIRYDPRKDQWQIDITFKGIRIYSPVFQDLSKAMQCRDIYVALALENDQSKELPPSRSKLKAIADEIRYGPCPPDPPSMSATPEGN